MYCTSQSQELDAGALSPTKVSCSAALAAPQSFTAARSLVPQILGEASKRKQYDTWGSAGDFGAGAGAGPGGFQGFQSSIDPEELFRKIFGDLGFGGQRGGARGFQQQQDPFSNYGFADGPSQQMTMSLSFQQAARGVNRDITLNVLDTCATCKGSRAASGTKVERCPQCNGTGMETVSTGPFVMQSTCRRCHGTTQHVPHPCQTCQGRGSTMQRKTVTVPVPAELKSFSVILVRTRAQSYSQGNVLGLRSSLLAPTIVCSQERFPHNKWQISRTFHGSGYNSQKDFYKILGVPKNAPQKDVKKAYYELAKKYHPDTSKNDPDASRKFKEVSEAYEILGEASKRKQYDTWGSAGDFGAGAGAGPGGFQGFQSSIDPEELFRKIFGDLGFGGQRGGARGFQQQQDPFSNYGFADGPSQQMTMSLSFQQAARGVNRDITLNVLDTCATCKGSRAASGTKVEQCPQCNGTGMETVSTGPFVMQSTCRRCHGTTQHVPHPCQTCQGRGSTMQRKTVTVPVPAGVDDGQTVRMPIGKKEIFITFRVQRSDYFRRDGADVHTDAVIGVAQAILGGSVRVQGLYEDVNLAISPGTSSHVRVRLANKGIARVNSHGFGDHYVHIKVKVPTKLDEKQRALLLAFAELDKDSTGTVNGIVQTETGNRAADDEDEELVAEIRRVVNGDAGLGKKKIADEIEEVANDTRQT
ncbi:PREDICTED: protein tumorous imaginal discs, mitochondrial-like [Priapulus caudatus]|uniref:Protein tumorous imaginal discs, mitochondrial-like n=1 Tax=Priapulus caudatus TaxID=37621 RepID=A0ABM1E8V7_PRICU|nr:PREDICTED: protein tumorous imaginal discs, mitochondrial-like [Priapulus caudatus]